MATVEGIILDCAESVAELSAVLERYDDTGDVDMDVFIRDSAVAAAMLFSQVSEHRGRNPEITADQVLSQQQRIVGNLKEFYSADALDMVMTVVTKFTSDLVEELIDAIDEDSTMFPQFKEINKDNTLLFNMYSNQVIENDQHLSGGE